MGCTSSVLCCCRGSDADDDSSFATHASPFYATQADTRHEAYRQKGRSDRSRWRTHVEDVVTL